MRSIIEIERSIIPACDVEIDRYEEIVRETHDIEQVGAYKISAILALSVGLPTVVEIARRYTSKPLIYDHQKAGTDIPDTGKGFAAMLKKCGINAMILFPLAGPATQIAWTQSAQEADLPIIVGGYMTHERFCVSEGGYIDDAGIRKMYSNAASHGVRDYVVPGNKPAVIREIRSLLLANKLEPVFYAPGFISQGGNISEAASIAGPRWHTIVGRAIYEAYDIRRATLSLTTNL
jgi:orotidine-5'-phosphate decarboxylase